MNKRKSILAAVVLTLVLLVGGALAYFTDTDTKTNTFTLGDVDITLSEPSWVAANAEDILPGATIAKDPQITNNDAKAFVFLKVTEPCYNNATVFDFTVNSGWTAVGTARTCSGNSAETVYAYGTASTMTELAKNATTTALFNNVTLKTTIDETAVQSLSQGDIQIVVDAYGIQADNVTGTPAQIFANFS